MCGFTCSAPGTPLDWLSETAGLGFLPTRGQGRVIDRSGRPTPLSSCLPPVHYPAASFLGRRTSPGAPPLPAYVDWSLRSPEREQGSGPHSSSSLGSWDSNRVYGRLDQDTWCRVDPLQPPASFGKPIAILSRCQLVSLVSQIPQGARRFAGWAREASTTGSNLLGTRSLPLAPCP